MKKIYNPPKESWSEILKRPILDSAAVEETVNEIFNEVKTKGDSAIIRYTNLFDDVQLNNITITENEIKEANKLVSNELKAAIKLSKFNIEKFHKAQKSKSIRVETSKGVDCWQENRPIQKVGLYIPGGTAPLFSTILMLAVPAS